MVTYTLTAQDFSRGERLWAIRRDKALWLGSAIFGVIAAWYVVGGRHLTVGQALLGIAAIPVGGAAFLVLMARVRGFMAGRNFRSWLEAHEPHQVAWDAHGISIDTPSGNKHRSWATIRGMVQNSNVMLFLLSGRHYLVVPKRGFTAGQLQDIHAVATRGFAEARRSAR